MAAIEGLAADLRRQREFLRDTCPVYRRLLEALIETLPNGLGAELLSAWSGRSFAAWYGRPLLVLASLRYAALRAGPCHPLAHAIGRDAEPGAKIAPEAVAAATARGQRTFWQALSQRAVQTNETSRAVAWMWPAWLITRGRDVGLELYDIGASAGLNLVGDALPAPWTDVDGSPLPLGESLKVHRRVGFDASPLLVERPDDALWLEACVWPDDRERLQRLKAGIAAFLAASSPAARPILYAASAKEIPGQLPRPGHGRVALAYQTIVEDYLGQDELETYRQGMARWLSSCDPLTAVWLRLEAVGDPQLSVDPARFAAITATLHTATGELLELELARCHPHPKTLRINREQVESFAGLFTTTT